MRRKLFFITVVSVVGIFLLDSLGIPVSRGDLQYVLEKKGSYTARVLSVEKKKDKYNIEVSLLDEKSGEWSDKSMLLGYYGEIEEPWSIWGSVITFDAKPERPQSRRNPHCFDYEKYLKSKGTEAVASIKNFKEISKGRSFADKATKAVMKRKFMFTESLDERSRGIIAGILFGDTSLLEEDIYEDFKVNNTAHILAVSGLHIAIIYKGIEFITRSLNHKIRIGVITITLAALGTAALWSPSVIRAGGMIALRIYCKYADERYDFLTALSAVALIMIFKNPYVIFNTGFQMSFLSAASIEFFLPHIPDKIPDFMAVTLAVNIGLMPYQWFTFNSVSWSSFIANAPAVYLAGILVPMAALRFLAFCAGAELVSLNTLVDSVSFLTVKINELSSLEGNGAVDMISPPLGLVVLFYLGAFFAASETFEVIRLRNEKGKLLYIIAVFVLLSAAFGILAREPVGEDEMVFVDVGQGDCFHLKECGLLIDGGGNINYNIGKNTLKPYLLKNGSRAIDAAIATHLHTDHYKGLKELKEEGMIDCIYTGLTAGRKLRLSEEAAVETLWPAEILEEQDENSNCSVFMVYYKNIKILITGDLDAEGEAAMMDFYRGGDKLKANILKIGHHGSKNSTSDEFLEAVDPRYCVIQVGKNNYGHPDAKIIEKCCQKGIIVLRNDIHGAVGFSIRDGKVECHTMIDTKGKI